MNALPRKLLGILTIGLSWGVAWTIVLVALGLIIGGDPPNPGETRWQFVSRAFSVGVVAGATFGILLSLAERRRSPLELSWQRVLLWAALAGAAHVVVLGTDAGTLFNTVPLAALSAMASLAIARWSEQQPERSTWLTRVIANPLRAACGASGTVS